MPDGDPEGVKIVELMNWTGVGVMIPRSAWQHARRRPEFRRAGVYMLEGPTEGMDEELPTFYVGQADEIGTRVESHYANKDFWDRAYAFVSSTNTLNRAHITWLEHQLLQRAELAGRCILDNVTQPKEPGLTESEKADTQAFLNEMLRILPLLGVRVFEKAEPVARPTLDGGPLPAATEQHDPRDTVVVPANLDGFDEVFLGQDCWYAIRIGGGMLSKIKYIAAYQTAPVSAITHFARVEQIEPYGDEGKYRLIFAEPAQALQAPVVFGGAQQGSMQGPRYTSLARLQKARTVADLFEGP